MPKGKIRWKANTQQRYSHNMFLNQIEIYHWFFRVIQATVTPYLGSFINN